MANRGRRPRRNAFFGRAHYEETTGQSHNQLQIHAVRHHRKQLATEAMQHVRSIVPQGPANVMRENHAQEYNRFDEFHDSDNMRKFVNTTMGGVLKSQRQDLVGGMSDNSIIYGSLATTSTIKRIGKCMEMSSMAANHFGDKLQDLNQKINNINVANDPNDTGGLKEHYETLKQAMSDVSLVKGVNNATGSKHMWVRMGRRNSVGSVALDAWGKGGAVKSTNYTGQKLFPNMTDIPLSQKELTDMSKITKDITTGQLRGVIADIKHQVPESERIMSGTPQMGQHFNELKFSRPTISRRVRRPKTRTGLNGI